MIDSITMELMRSSLYYASEEMGIALRNSSYSPNIKERMDHSAAVFDTEARLIAQAEHIPVHLGSLPWGLSNTLAYCQKEGIGLKEGSMIVVNNPYIAGTHLNDVTVIRPIYHRGKLIAFSANKAHHSDIGGKVPGSISSDARSLYEEGLIINPTYLMRNNEFVDETLSFFRSNTRTPKERIGDLRAQAAANFTGERRVIELAERYGLQNFSDSVNESFNYTQRIVSNRISALKEGEYKAEDFLESPDEKLLKMAARLKIKGGKIFIDYTGTEKQVPFPLNAVFGVTLSGVQFVLRSLLGEDIPVNNGTFRDVEVSAPEGILLNPEYPAPVSGGNVETSQRNADLVFKLFVDVFPGLVPAASGGSMNNIMMGGNTSKGPWAFYETIGVGLGGRKGMDGIDGIHSNMTNTMNTPVEEVELSMPIRVKRYEFRQDSSGAGEFRGGSGIVRSFEILSETMFTVVAERGKLAPWGLYGGMDGSKTRVTLERNGEETKVPIKSSTQLLPGDIITIETAGGGGYGNPGLRVKSKVLKDVENEIITREKALKDYELTEKILL